MRAAVLPDTQQFDRRTAIVRLLRNGLVRKQGELVSLLLRDGYAATQSSVSRDLRDLGVLKAGGRYVMPSDEVTRANGDFGALALFVRQILPAGTCLTVVKTTIGAAGSVAVAIDKAEWPEVIGTISGDDTIFVATNGEPAQVQLIARLRSNFRV
jgi:transcriptional regulator of arginine metabolism